MIIGIDASRANLKHKTGTQWYSFYLIKNLAQIDKTNQYWLYVNEPPSLELVAAVKENPNFIFKFLEWPFLSFWTLGRLTLEMLIKRPDVLFIPAHGLPLFGPRRTINTIHDVAFVREQNLYFSSKASAQWNVSKKIINGLVRALTFGKYGATSVDYLYWSTAFSLRHAKKIIAVSEFTKSEIISLYNSVPQNKVDVIYNGYNNDLYKPLTDQNQQQVVLNKYGLDYPFFLYVGRLEKKKNTVTLIEAFALFMEENPDSPMHLVLIGDAGYGYDEVKYVIEEFDLSDRVIMPGWLDEVDLPAIFNAASAFVFPSKHEGFGIPVLQALACGIPAIISDLPVLREVVGEAALYFNQNNRLSITMAMNRIIKDEELRRELKERGLKQVQSFSWEKCATETLQLIKSL